MELVKEVARSTIWARANRAKVAARDKQHKATLKGKLTSLATQSKYRSSKTGLGHEVNSKYLQGMYDGQGGLCALSGLVMNIAGERGSADYWHSISIDRIDSSKGYLIGNVQLVCTGVNYMKKDMADEMFINFCKKVAEVNL